MVESIASPADRRRQADRAAAAVAQLYLQKTLRAEMTEALDLSCAQVDKLLNELFAEGMPKLHGAA